MQIARMQKCPSMRSHIISAMPPTKMILLSLALSVSALLQRTSAFVPPSSWRAINNPSSVAVSPSIGSTITIFNANHYLLTRHEVEVCTKLWAATMNDDDSNETPKATNKGTQKKPSKQTSKSSSTTNKPKTKSKSGIKTKGTKQTQTKKQQQTKKTPLEISAQSLSPSQAQSKPANINADEEEEGEDPNNYASDYHIPKTGYSLADQLENNSPENRERFETTLTPIVVGIRSSSDGGDGTKRKEEEKVEILYDDEGFPTGYKQVADEEGSEDEEAVSRHQGVARIDTISTLGNVGEEPVKWLVNMAENNNDGKDDEEKESYALIDLPPYSDKLANEIRSFMDPTYNATASDSSSEATKANLDVILLTNQQCIHYDTSPGVYITRKSDLTKWKTAFPSAEVVMYRLDIPRECRAEVTQVLDGYGPWGWEEQSVVGAGKFIETGRPLKIDEWDDDTKTNVLSKGELPPDDQVSEDDDSIDEDDELYSTKAIRAREERHRLLAVYTPGHTFGSVTYIFPKRGICCSGYTLPLESAGGETTMDDEDGDEGYGSAAYAARRSPQEGPRLDYQGYLATSASRPRQMSSASTLINNYIDRFSVVLPARGDLVFLNSEKEVRKRELMESVGLYQKIGEIYGRLGIVEK